MKREFRKIVSKLQRIKFLFNWDISPKEGGIVSRRHTIKLTRIDKNTLVERLKFWIAGPAEPITKKSDGDKLIRRIQMDLIEDKTDFHICGSVDLVVHYEAEKEVLDEIIEFQKQHKKHIAYFEKAGNTEVENLMKKFGFVPR